MCAVYVQNTWRKTSSAYEIEQGSYGDDDYNPSIVLNCYTSLIMTYRLYSLIPGPKLDQTVDKNIYFTLIHGVYE